jgi:hypothetical protein
MIPGLLLSALALAAPAPGVDCKVFEATIEGALKSAGLSAASTVDNNSVYRHIDAELEIANKLKEIDLNLQLMATAPTGVRSATW